MERLYRINVAAKLVGVSEPVLRAWERRYGLVKPRRTGGGYRAYAEVDIALLRRIKALTDEGMSIAEAARHAPEIRRELDAPAASPSPAGLGHPSLGGRWSKEILRAALAGDQARIEAVLDEALSMLPPLTVVDRLMLPVLREVGDQWHEGKLGVAQEHLVSHPIRVRLLSLLHGAPRGARRHALCACLPDEDHELGLLSAALRLRHAGYRITYLGPRTPSDQLGRLAESLRPDAVLLCAVNDDGPKQLKAALVAAVRALPKGTRVYAGGAAVDRHGQVAEELGIRCLVGPEDWNRLLR